MGWNSAEYEAIGEDSRTRGTKSRSRIAVLRAFLDTEVVTFEGRSHHIVEAGIDPLPVGRRVHLDRRERGSVAAPHRASRLGMDGRRRYPRADKEARGTVSGGPQTSVVRLREYAREAGRDPAEIGLQRGVNAADPPDQVIQAVAEWAAIGART